MRQLLTKLANLYDNQLGDAEKAIASFQRAVDIDPGDTSSLDALEMLYSRDQNWAQLLDVYRQKVELESDPQTREDLRFKIASLQEDMLGQAQEAISTYNEIPRRRRGERAGDPGPGSSVSRGGAVGGAGREPQPAARAHRRPGCSGESQPAAGWTSACAGSASRGSPSRRTARCSTSTWPTTPARSRPSRRS